MANGNTDASSDKVEPQQPTLEATSSRQHNDNPSTTDTDRSTASANSTDETDLGSASAQTVPISMANSNTDTSSVIVEPQQPTLEATSCRQHNDNPSTTDTDRSSASANNTDETDLGSAPAQTVPISMANGNIDTSSVIVELQQNDNDLFGNVTSSDISLTCPLYVGFISPSMKLNEMIENPPNASEGEISAARKKMGTEWMFERNVSIE